MEIVPIEPGKPGSMREFLTRHVTSVDIGAGIIIILLTMTTVMYGLRYGQVLNDLQRANIAANQVQTNKQVLSFARLFVNKVLRAEGEIDFETRLQLEGAVRTLNDQAILAAWQAFTESKTEKQAQDAVKNLLALLLDKIQ